MPLNNAALYACHVDNLRAVTTGVEHVGRQLRAALGSSQETTARTLLRIQMLLIGAWSEGRLHKLLYEDGGFSDQERSSVFAKRQKIEQWEEVVHLGFKRRYGVGDLAQLRQEAATRLQVLEALIDRDLRPIIEIRNRLAHGQWEKAFNSAGRDLSQAHMRALADENALSAQFKQKMIDGLADLGHDLVSTKFAFERDFDEHYRRITALRDQLRNKSYARYLAGLIDKATRGALARDQRIREARE